MKTRLDEAAHSGTEHLDPAYVAGYDTKTGFDVGIDVDLLRGLGLGPGTTLVDLGAGTGLLSAAVAWLLEPMLERAGFAVADAWYAESRTYARYVCTQR